MAKELVLISGKGGTGKTSLVASFAALSKSKVLADCDVDAADLHLIVSPQIEYSEPFSGSKRALIKSEECLGCGGCEELCVFGAIHPDGTSDRYHRSFHIDPMACEGCGVCAWFCPASAIELTPRPSGQWFVSRTRFGPMVHGELRPGEENSGKLVSKIREKARAIAEDEGLELVIIDGAPGVGCPVIASVTGADMALIVTEPTLSGLHDLKRVVLLLKHFGIPGAVCINKHDINPGIAEKVEISCRESDISIAGRIRYSEDVVRAIVSGEPVVEYSRGPIAKDVQRVWLEVENILQAGKREKDSDLGISV
jgi:MinD superfamily P-loop ATPase